jgi:hypothetical protein
VQIWKLAPDDELEGFIHGFVAQLAQVIPHHETFSTTIQPPYSSTKG